MKGLPAPNYTQVPNAILDMLPAMKEAELRVTLAIARETFGWHRPAAALSITDLMKLIGMSRQAVLNGVNQSMERGTVDRAPAVTKGQAGYSYRLVVNEGDSQVVFYVDTPAKSSQRSRLQGVNEVDSLTPDVAHRTALNGTPKESLKKDQSGREARTRARSNDDHPDWHTAPARLLPTGEAVPPPAPNLPHLDDLPPVPDGEAPLIASPAALWRDVKPRAKPAEWRQLQSLAATHSAYWLGRAILHAMECTPDLDDRPTALNYVRSILKHWQQRHAYGSQHPDYARKEQQREQPQRANAASPGADPGAGDGQGDGAAPSEPVVDLERIHPFYRRLYEQAAARSP